MNDLYFKVADAHFRIKYNDSDDVRRLIPSYAPFHIQQPETDDCIFTMNVGSELVPETPEGKEIGHFDGGDAKHDVYQLENGGYYIFIRDYLDKATCALRTNADFSICETTLFGDEACRSYGLNNSLMIAFAFAGAHHHILLMHASVIMNQGYGYLFLGKSGTGKSTHSKLWLDHIAGSELLNDDNPAVRVDVEHKSVTVYGSPWSGKTPCYRNLQVPVGAFLRLQQYSENIIRKEPSVRGFATILSSCSTMIWDKPSYDAICDTVATIAGITPAFHLQCLPDKAAAELSYSHLSRH